MMASFLTAQRHEKNSLVEVFKSPVHQGFFVSDAFN